MNTEDQPRNSQRKTIAIVVSVMVVAIALIVVGAVVLVNQDSSDGPSASPSSKNKISDKDGQFPQELTQYYEQDVDWSDCSDGVCADVSVPIDYEKPDGETMTLAVKKAPATSDEPRGPLLINPGGPGASGIEFLTFFQSEASKDVREAYDLIGFDPRGTGDSTPLKCFDNKTLDEFNASDATPDTSKEITEARTWMERLGQACEENSGELAAHVSTEETARDMDVLRFVLGAPKLDYYGASYGTQLGATYATLFPKNVGRLVLDGAVDPSQDEEGFAQGQNEGFQRALTAYLEDCTQQDDCPLGTDVDKAEKQLKKFVDDLDENPIKVGDRELTQSLAMYGIAVTLYNKQSWTSLSLELKNALDGDGAMMLRLSDLYFDRAPDGTYNNNSTEANIAISCMDGQEPVSNSDVKKALPKFEDTSLVFGAFMAWGMVGCDEWPIEAANPQPEIDASGSAPILVVGTTRDPATPYEWSQALTKQLGSGVLLTREGDGHTGYHQGSSCTDEAIDTYLLDGDVPDDGATCQ